MSRGIRTGLGVVGALCALLAVLLVVGGTGVASDVGHDLFVAAATPRPTPAATPQPPDLIPNAPVLYPAARAAPLPTDKLLATAASLSKAPVVRQEVRSLTYGQFVAWSGGARVFTIAPERQVYLVLTEGKLESPVGLSCRVYFQLVDAMTGMIHATGCRGDSWPTNLPGEVTATR